MTYDDFKNTIENIALNLDNWTGEKCSYGFRIAGMFHAENGTPCVVMPDRSIRIMQIKNDAIVVDNGIGAPLVLIPEMITAFAVMVIPDGGKGGTEICTLKN